MCFDRKKEMKEVHTKKLNILSRDEKITMGKILHLDMTCCSTGNGVNRQVDVVPGTAH